MSALRKILLFHPATDGVYMPLSLLAVARLPVRDGFEVEIVDAGIDGDYRERLAVSARSALCLGITVLTGRSIQGAIEATRIVRAVRHELPVIWGGWHPSILPEQCLEVADVAVIGQGEETLSEIVQRLAHGESLNGCAGICFGTTAEPRRTAPRAFAEIDRLPPMSYDLLPIEAYFARKGKRQAEYVSSYGCSFNCTFCADPLVVKRRWTALPAARVVAEVGGLVERFGVEDLIFADDHFFNNPRRVASICRGLATLPRRPRWFATARADVFAAHHSHFLDLLQPAGCRTVFFGVESGDEALRKRLGKGISHEDLVRCARMCEERGIETNFTYIVGLPGETPVELDATIREAAELRIRFGGAHTKLFFYSPYPGTALFEEASRRGMTHAGGLLAWASAGDHDAAKPWISPEYRRRIEIASFYHGYMNQRGPAGLAGHALAKRLMKAAARMRGRLGFYRAAIEYRLAGRKPVAIVVEPGPRGGIGSDSSAPSVTVVIPSRNRIGTLITTLESVCSQEYPRAFDLIVVDDGSSDGTADIVRERSWRREVRVVTTHGVGPAEARNRGVACSESDIIAFIDDDCVAAPGWLAALASAAAGGAAGGRTIMRTDGSLIGDFNAWRWRRAIESAGANPPVLTCNAAFRRELLAEGFDPTFRRAGLEDTDLVTRLRDKGVPVASAPEAVVEHAPRAKLVPLVRTAYNYGRGWGYWRRKRGHPVGALRAMAMIASLPLFPFAIHHGAVEGIARAAVYAFLNRLMLAAAGAGVIFRYRNVTARSATTVKIMDRSARAASCEAGRGAEDAQHPMGVRGPAAPGRGAGRGGATRIPTWQG